MKDELEDSYGKNYSQSKNSLALEKIIVDRLRELTLWLNLGGKLITILSMELPLVNTGGNHWLDLKELPPLSWIKITPSFGHEIQLAGSAATQRLLAPKVSDLFYHHVLEGEKLDPLLCADSIGPDQIVAGLLKLDGGGIVLYLPTTRGWTTLDNSQPRTLAAEWMQLAISLADVLQATQPSLPHWTLAYRDRQEVEALEQSAKYREEIRRLEGLIARQQEIINSAQQDKHLFAGTGPPFEAAANRILTELGLKVEYGPKGRADLVAWDGKRLATVEAKGLTGPAKEKDARQCEQWVREVTNAYELSPDERDENEKRYAAILEKLGVPPFDPDNPITIKGLMVIGTFRETLLKERNEPDFPHAMRKTIVRNKHCALTGLQLLGMWLDARDQPDRREDLVDKLFNTIGVLKDYEDWARFLHSTADKKDDES